MNAITMRRNNDILILILGALIAISPFSIDMYLPSFPAIASSLDTNLAAVGYSLTSYHAGLCIGQLAYGILIDRFGRKKPLVAGLIIYIIAALLCALSTSITSLVVVRLFMALGGCVGMVAARAIVRDIFPSEETAKILSTLVLVMGIAPIIAPTIGGIVNNLLGWPWVFGVMATIALTILIAVKWLLPETKAEDKFISLKVSKIFPEYLTVLKNPTFLSYTLAGGISYAGMYAYIAGSPFVFMEKFGFTDGEYGWAFAFNACGLITGSQLNRVALKRFTSEKICYWAAILLFFTGLLFLITAVSGLANAFLALVFTFLFLFCVGFINPNTTALALKEFQAATGRASAVLGSLQMIAGVIASGLISLLHNGSLVIMPMVMFGCTVMTLFLLWRSKFYVSFN
ncbi:multidrug effflux MFS transporter [Desertivirga brevis]|uniref:multidrug effflux MFS transporter n=1 Tax=Desertivirga brevis TaxID=2810310 RepID=UPI001A958D71|nr:multidrug effflux MFS transporter [Pedobacter sp. SYSU D00873]